MAHHWAATGEVLDHPYARLLEKHIDECGIDRLALWPAEGRVKPFAFAIRATPLDIQVTEEQPFAPWKASWDQDWMTGDLDYAQVIGPVGWVDDMKTGRPEDPDCDQVASYCTGLWLSHDCGLNTVRRSVTHWPRPNLYAKNPRAFKPPVRYWGTDMSDADLRDFVHRLIDGQLSHAALLDCDNPENYANPGDWCTWCPARTFCPAGDN